MNMRVAPVPAGAEGEEMEEGAPSARVLQRLVLGEHEAGSLFVRDAVAALGDRPDRPGTAGDRVRAGYDMLRTIIRRLGGSQAVSADFWLSSALCDWAAQLAPHVLPFLTGHVDLTVAVIERLGTGGEYQRRCLAELNAVDAVGVMLLTELGYGTNTIGLESEAVWRPDPAHPDGGWFVLRTPSPAAVKIPPNVGAESVPKTVVVLARLRVHGKDEGVWPFLVRLRTKHSGLAAGVAAVALPDNRIGPLMDHAAVVFDDVEIPRDALLCGNLARLDDAGFHCELAGRERFATAVGGLQAGRIKLSRACVASARAALALAVRYTGQRRAGFSMMSELDNVQRDLVQAAAALYAMTTLANRVGQQFVARDPSIAMWAMVTKPLMTYTAFDVLETCRQRLGAQGFYSANYLGMYLGTNAGSITAEGESQSLLVAAGARLASSGAGPEAVELAPWVGEEMQRPWWEWLVYERQRSMLDTARAGEIPAVAGAVGKKSAAMDLATAVGEWLAVDALSRAQHELGHDATRNVVADLCAIYALNTIRRHALWYSAHGLLDQEQATVVECELVTRTRGVAPQLMTLTAAFALPATAAPIGSADYIAAWIERIGLQERFLDTAA